MLAALSACSGVAQTATQTAAPSNQTDTAVAYSDPYAYCAAVGQIDAPDGRYTGDKMDDALFKDYLTAAGLKTDTDYPDSFKQATVWRCMSGKVYACNFGANIPCDSKADTNKTPTQAMNDYCTQNPGSTFIPMSVTGHTTIYNWQCKDKTAEAASQAEEVDAAGYASSFWTELSQSVK